MKKKRADWEINHGKHVHEFLLYDLVKYVAEIDLTKSNIPYDKIKTINKINVSYNKDNRFIEIEYVDKKNKEQVLTWNVPALYLNDKEITYINHVTYTPDSNQLYEMHIRLVDGSTKDVYVPVMLSETPGSGLAPDGIGSIRFFEDNPYVMTRADFKYLNGSHNTRYFYNALVDDNGRHNFPMSSEFQIKDGTIKNIIFKYAGGTSSEIDFYAVVFNALYNNRGEPMLEELFRYYYDKFKAEDAHNG